MAPRAGLEVSRKYLTGNDRRNTGKAYTPSDTPKRRRCKFTVEWVDGRLPTSLSSAASLPLSDRFLLGQKIFRKGN